MNKVPKFQISIGYVCPKMEAKEPCQITPSFCILFKLIMVKSNKKKIEKSRIDLQNEKSNLFEKVVFETEFTVNSG